MTIQEYNQWLSSREDQANKAREPSSMQGLAGELKVGTLEQFDVNVIAAKQLQLIEEEKEFVSKNRIPINFSDRQGKLMEKLDSVHESEE